MTQLETKIETADADRISKQKAVVELRKTLLNSKIKPSGRAKDDDGRVVARGGSYYQNWTTPCPKFMKRFQPEKECPIRIYEELR